MAGFSLGGATRDKNVVYFIGINAWLLSGCFSIISIFMGKVLFRAEKILIIVFPSFFEVFILAKLSKRFAYPAFISIGLTSSEETKSPYVAKFILVIFRWISLQNTEVDVQRKNIRIGRA